MKGIGTSALIRRILAVVLVLSLIIGVGSFYAVLRHRALEAGSKEAHLLLRAGIAVSGFTSDQLFRLMLELPPEKFYQQLVPFYAQNAVYQRLRAEYPAYTFRQPALNPTNTNDRPTPHEVELIGRFNDDPSLTILQGTRQDNDRTLLYIARPVRITQPACLTCHSTPEAAPAAMVAKYGASNGFGWELNQTVGMVEVSVPITEELRGIAELTTTLAAGLFLVFLITYLALTSALNIALVNPLRHLAAAAEAASRSGESAPELPPVATLELKRLSDAIRRLDTSLRKSLRQLSAGRAELPPENSDKSVQ
jgi:protein-histidine pros-kinase